MYSSQFPAVQSSMMAARKLVTLQNIMDQTITR
jgi:hypothetical protein